MEKLITIALAGNPNAGKTTLFNNLTGARQHVGNYPGVTVERKEGTCTHGGYRIEVVDLPGTYSLTAYSTEEVVARDFIIEAKPSVVVDVVDASNLERNLYLTTQLIELGAPLVLALNMSDEAERRGFAIDTKRLGELLGARIVRTVGHKGRGTAELLDAIVAVAEGHGPPATVSYGHEIEEEIAKLVPLIEAEPEVMRQRTARWAAVKLLEDDAVFREQLAGWTPNAEKLVAAAVAARRHLQKIFGDSAEIVLADHRYGFISGACQEAVVHTVEARHSMSDRIDAVVTHPVAGIPIFLLLTYLMFQFTFSVGAIPTGWLEGGFGWLGARVAELWPKSSESALRSLLVDGVIGGVGGVLTFVPYVMLLFLAIAVLEDSGYMARAAFIMDSVMHRIGLHGKSFIPMLIGFGCSVPAILATRTLDSRRDRLTTMLVLPLVSCSARLLIYSVLIAAFFPNRVLADLGFIALRLQPVILMAIYLIGIVLAIVAARLLRATVLRGETTPLVMELPPYRMPTWLGLVIHMWERAWLYVKKAGTVILGFSVILWVLTSYPKKSAYDQDYVARQRAAEEAYVRSVAALAEPLGAKEDEGLLGRYGRAEASLRWADERYYPREPGSVEAGIILFSVWAEVYKSDRTSELPPSAQGVSHPRLRRFLEFRKEIRQARSDFEREVDRHRADPESSAYHVLQARRDEKLANLERRDPRAYAAAMACLDEILPRYEAAVAPIEHEKAAERLAWSAMGRVGHAIEPLLRPIGFDWRIGTALVGALGAREVFVAQMGILYAVGSGEEHAEALRQHLRGEYRPLVGFCLMLFILISAPCLPTLAATRRESGRWGWALFQLGSLTALAYLLTLITYQAGRLVGIGG